jgi:hypothetical protein
MFGQIKSTIETGKCGLLCSVCGKNKQNLGIIMPGSMVIRHESTLYGVNCGVNGTALKKRRNSLCEKRLYSELPA